MSVVSRDAAAVTLVFPHSTLNLKEKRRLEEPRGVSFVQTLLKCLDNTKTQAPTQLNLIGVPSILPVERVA